MKNVTSLFILTCVITMLFLGATTLIKKCYAGAVCSALSSTLQQYVNTTALPSAFSAYVQTAMKKNPPLWERRDQIVDVLNFRVDNRYSGQLYTVIKNINPETVILSYQVLRRSEPYTIISLRLAFPSADAHKKEMAALKAESDIVVVETDRPLAKKKGWEKEYANTHRITYYMSVKMLYTTPNIQALFKVLANHGLSINSFLFPEYIETKREAVFRFEVSIAERNYHRHYLGDDESLLHDRVVTSLQRYTSDIIPSDVEIEPEGRISSVLICNLLEELSIDIRNDEQLVYACDLLHDKFPSLRKDFRTPYVVHMTKAVKILVNEFGVTDLNAIIALLLHDSVEDGLVTIEELAELVSPEVVEIVRRITRPHKIKRFWREVAYLDGILTGDTEESRKAALAKISDRIQNLRSTDIGKPHFHRKIFFETLSTFMPNFLDDSRLMDMQFDAHYGTHFRHALEAVYAEIVMRGMYFGFILPTGQINEVELSLYLQENVAYFSKPLFIPRSVRAAIDQRQQVSFYQSLIDRLMPYHDASMASLNLFYEINEVDSPHAAFASFLDDEENYHYVDFLPHRIKSSVVVLLHRLFAKQIPHQPLDEHMLKDTLSELSTLGNQSPLIEEMANLFIRYMSEPGSADAHMITLLNSIFTSYTARRRVPLYVDSTDKNPKVLYSAAA